MNPQGKRTTFVVASLMALAFAAGVGASQGLNGATASERAAHQPQGEGREVAQVPGMPRRRTPRFSGGVV